MVRELGGNPDGPTPNEDSPQEGGVTGQVRSFPRWGAMTLLDPALAIDAVKLLESRANGREDRPSGSRAWREPELLKQPLLETFWGKKRWGSGVNEMNSHLQTGPSGGICAEPPFQAPA